MNDLWLLIAWSITVAGYNMIWDSGQPWKA